jgi:uncharacterized cupin superfamily protein
LIEDSPSDGFWGTGQDRSGANWAGRVLTEIRDRLKAKLASGGTQTERSMSKRIDTGAVQSVVGTTYPAPFDETGRTRERKRLGDVAGLTQFGVNLLRLPPGAWSSQRHWHTTEDEFIYVVSGEVTLVTNAGAEILRAGDCAGFKANDSDGHCLQNRSGADATVLEVGTRDPANNMAYYIDMMVKRATGYTHRDGTPYPKNERRGP